MDVIAAQTYTQINNLIPHFYVKLISFLCFLSLRFKIKRKTVLDLQKLPYNRNIPECFATSIQSFKKIAPKDCVLEKWAYVRKTSIWVYNFDWYSHFLCANFRRNGIFHLLVVTKQTYRQINKFKTLIYNIDLSISSFSLLWYKIKHKIVKFFVCYKSSHNVLKNRFFLVSFAVAKSFKCLK